MHQALIVARMAPGSAPDIAKLFEESDRGELPHLVGVARRSLFQFGDVYLHLIESEQEPGPAIAKVTGHPEFRAVSERLSQDVISLPIHAYLDEPTQDRIIKAVRDALAD